MYVFQEEVPVDEILKLLSGLHEGAGPTLTHKPVGPADTLDGGRYGTSRAGPGAAAQGDKSRGMGAGHGKDGVGEALVVGKGRSRRRPLRKSAMGILRERK